MESRAQAANVVFLVVLLGALSVSIFSRGKSNDHATLPPQTAIASGGSTIILAHGNVTIINPDVHEETERARLRDESAKLENRLAQKYPLGYALIGVANGRIVWEPNVTRFSITGDWKNWRIVIDNEGRPLARLIVSKVNVDGSRIEDSSIEVPYYDGAFAPMGWIIHGVYTYFEVIDTKQHEFAIGFSDKPLS